MRRLREASVPRKGSVVVLASGKGSNVQALVEAGREGRIPAGVVLVMSDRPDAGALERAAAAGIESLVVSRSQYRTRKAHEEALAVQIDRVHADVVCLAGYMRLLGAEFVARYRWRLLNIHPSLLPAFPGVHGVADALSYGVKVTGCTVHFVDEGTDTGPVIVQAAVPVCEGDTVDTLTARIQCEEHRIYPEAVRLLCEGRLKVEGRQVTVVGARSGGRRLSRAS